MKLAERVLDRYKGASNRALSDAEYQKAASDVLHATKRLGADIAAVRQDVVNMALTLKDRGHFRDASTLMELAPAPMDTLEHLSPMVERLKHAPADIRKPAPAKPGAKLNPWTTPLR